MKIGALLKIILGGIAVLWLAGCSAGSSKNIPTPIEGYNHTSAAINGFTVNGSGGPNIGPHQGGRKQNCCMSLPEKWRPGMTVVVEWEKDPTPHASKTWPQPPFSVAWRKAAAEDEKLNTRHRAVVDIPPYDDVGAVVVHFLPCDEVKVIATLYGYRHPQYPIKEPLDMKEPKICQR
ncbi:DUF3304 domain-containing protein [Pseudomonas aeruginosa]